MKYYKVFKLGRDWSLFAWEVYGLASFLYQFHVQGIFETIQKMGLHDTKMSQLITLQSRDHRTLTAKL